MRFLLDWSRSRAIGDEFLEVQDDFFEDGTDAANGGLTGKQPTADLSLDLVEGQGSVDLVEGVQIKMLVGGDIDRQGVEVVADGLGTEVLPCGMPGEAGRVLQSEAALDPFVCFFNTPATVIELGEGFGREGDGIEQGRHDDVNFAIGRDHPHQANRRWRCRALVVGGILPVRCRQRHHLLAQTGAEKLAHHRQAGRDVAANTEMDPSGDQSRRQPATGESAVKEQQVVLFQGIERLEQHLPLVAQRFMQLEIEEQFDARKEETEGDAIDDRADVVFDDRQPNRAAIGRDDAQALPSRDPHVHIGQRDQFPIDVAKDHGTDLVACLEECLRSDFPYRVGAVREVGEELIEFGLDRALQSRQQEGDDGWEGEGTFPGESAWLKPGRLQQVFRKQIVGERVQDFDI